MTKHRHTWQRVGGVKENPGVWSIKATHPTWGGNGEALRFDEACRCGATRTGYSYNIGGSFSRTEWHIDLPVSAR